MTDFSKNNHLASYFLKMKKMLKAIMITSIVAEQGVFVVRDDTYAMTLKALSGVVPLFG